jgi:hypothetical protein
MTNRSNCGSCGMAVQVDDAFCGHCGATLPGPTSVTGAACPRCGADAGAGQRFCGTCGAPVYQDHQDLPATPTPPVSAAEPARRRVLGLAAAVGGLLVAGVVGGRMVWYSLGDRSHVGAASPDSTPQSASAPSLPVTVDSVSGAGPSAAGAAQPLPKPPSLGSHSKRVARPRRWPTSSDNPWTETAEQYRDWVGARVALNCQAGGPVGPVTGTDFYTDDSSICSAAVHAGRITLNTGGMAIALIQPGRAAFTGSSRNGLTSASRGPWPGSFMFEP